MRLAARHLNAAKSAGARVGWRQWRNGYNGWQRGSAAARKGRMTELLRRALAEVEKLPVDAQDAVATRILADLEDEVSWQTRFEATTAEQWNRLAEGARREIAAGDTIPIENAFPVRVTEG
jgi:hypothetical protein